MKKILSASEMKLVCGGAEPSSMCGEGEKLYTCSTSWMGGTVTNGSVCARGEEEARDAVDEVYMDQDVYADMVVVLCY